MSISNRIFPACSLEPSQAPRPLHRGTIPHQATAHAHAAAPAKFSAQPPFRHCSCTTVSSAPMGSNPTPHLASTAKTCCHTAAIPWLPSMVRLPAGVCRARAWNISVPVRGNLVPPLPPGDSCHKHEVPPHRWCREIPVGR